MRLFSTERYETKYTWLYYSYSNRGYMCKICEHFATGKKGIFITCIGLGDHPTRLLESHQNSNIHMGAIQTMVLSKQKRVNVHKLIIEAHQTMGVSNKEMNRSTCILKKTFEMCEFHGEKTVGTVGEF